MDLTKIYNRSLKGPLILFLILMLIPVVAPSAYVVSTMVIIGFYTLICTGMVMLMGYAGQISLGHAAFYGVGAYASAVLTVKLGMPPLVGVIVGACLAALIAYLVGLPTLKLTGHYLALATLGFGVIMFIFFKQLKSLTGGLDGFIGIPSFGLFGIEINTDGRYYYLVWILVLLGILLARNVLQSRVGRALRSIHGSEVAADAVGVDIQKYKLQVFVMSAVYASVAGSLYAHYVLFINPQLFDVMASIHYLIMVIIGGSSSIWGGLIGAFTFVVLGEVLKDFIPALTGHSGGEFEIVFFGLLLVVILIYMPEGLAPAMGKLWNKVSGNAKKKEKSISSDKPAGMLGDQTSEEPIQAAGGGR